MSAEDAACNKVTELALNDREVGCMPSSNCSSLARFVLMPCRRGMPLWRKADKS